MENVFGQALKDFYNQTHPETLWLHNNYGFTEEMPVDIFFRTPEEFPELEFIALSLCDGKTLDVGAGAGSHALYLQEQKIDVHALEQCLAACEIMTDRGVHNVIHNNFFEYHGQTFDTLLLMMNGIGLAGSLENVTQILEHSKTLLNPGGQILFDSSDLSYLYQDGTILKPTEHYFGEIGFQYEYKGNKGTPFGWVYVDQNTMIALAQASGWVIQILYEDEEDQYLARLELRSESDPSEVV